MLYESICACSGNEQTTVFVRPETCVEEYHCQHHQIHSCCAASTCNTHEHYSQDDDCDDCVAHTKDCGCEEPVAKLLKLKNQFDEELRYTLTAPVLLSIVSTETGFLQEETNEGEDDDSSYVDPPPKITSSLDFLIQIQQLKIPALA